LINCLSKIVLFIKSQITMVNPLEISELIEQLGLIGFPLV